MRIEPVEADTTILKNTATKQAPIMDSAWTGTACFIPMKLTCGTGCGPFNTWPSIVWSKALQIQTQLAFYTALDAALSRSLRNKATITSYSDYQK
jgi:hypothetical protein